MVHCGHESGVDNHLFFPPGERGVVDYPLMQLSRVVTSLRVQPPPHCSGWIVMYGGLWWLCLAGAMGIPWVHEWLITSRRYAGAGPPVCAVLLVWRSLSLFLRERAVAFGGLSDWRG